MTPQDILAIYGDKRSEKEATAELNKINEAAKAVLEKFLASLNKTK